MKRIEAEERERKELEEELRAAEEKAVRIKAEGELRAAEEARKLQEEREAREKAAAIAAETKASEEGDGDDNLEEEPTTLVIDSFVTPEE